MGAWKYRVLVRVPPHPVRSAKKRPTTMSMDQDRWSRVKERLRAEVGDDVYSSWFARMELDGSETDTVKLSVPTRFLKSWIQSHYADKLLACWQAEVAEVRRLEISMRSSVIRTLPPKAKAAVPLANQRDNQEA